MSPGNKRAPTVGLQEGRQRSRYRRSHSVSAHTRHRTIDVLSGASSSSHAQLLSAEMASSKGNLRKES